MKKNLSTVLVLVLSTLTVHASFFKDAGNWMDKHQKELGIGLGVAAGLGAAGAGAYYGAKKYKRSDQRFKRPELILVGSSPDSRVIINSETKNPVVAGSFPAGRGATLTDTLRESESARIGKERMQNPLMQENWSAMRKRLLAQ